MPFFIDGGRVPPRWKERQDQRSVSIDSYVRRADCIQIAFINNMPDAALEDTELQFFDLLDSVSGQLRVRLKLYSLPGIHRGEPGKQHLKDFYFEFDDLWNHGFDAVIVTGTEPCCSNLLDEPYWPELVQLLDWAEQNTVSAVCSCLAAHAAVLYSDGIERHRLSDKRFGVFEFNKVSNHLLTKHAVEVCFPHSRWNELQADALLACGYLILTHSNEAGVDSFVKTNKKSLFLHFQGHPEYGARTLFKEYRRDIKRFLRGERDTYPTMPSGYFDTAATKLLTEFREVALADPCEDVMIAFPEATITGTLRNRWHACAISIYRNWLEHVKSKKLQGTTFFALSSVAEHMYRRRSAARS
jgi:homoserine O-succinyltransferase